MSMPGNIMVSNGTPVDILAPDDLGRPSRLADYEEGGVAVNDASQGLRVKTWRARLDGNNVKLSASPYITEDILISVAGIKELSLSFDQNMRPMIAYIVEETGYLWWYDASVPGLVTTTLGVNVTSVYLAMDDKRPAAVVMGTNDVLAFYGRVGLLCYRQQRDRFLTERVVFDNAGVPINITRCGMNRGLRMQVEINGPEF